MGRHDWYRKTTWTPDDQQAFFDKLSRAKSWSAPQYAAIQAYCLADVGTRKLAEAALDLLGMVIERWLDDPIIESVHLERAKCLIRLERCEEAVEAFRNALRVGKQKPHGSNTTAALDSGMFAVCHGREDLHDEVLDAFPEWSTLTFPIHRYQHSVVLAIISDSCGYREEARRFAQRALEAAAVTHSGFGYHPKVGLLDKPEPQIHKRVQRLAR